MKPARTACLVLAMTLAVLPLAWVGSPAHAQTPGGTFDGSWAVTLACPRTADGVAGYTYRFLVQVTNGVLRGENGVRGRSGWLLLEGPIQPDGTATLSAEGLTGSPATTVGRVPPLSPVKFHANAHFDARQGAGMRIELRPCTLAFVRP